MELPKLIKLSASGEIRSRRNRKIVLRYHKPNKENVLEIINQKKQIFEPNSDLIDNYAHQIHQGRNTYQDDNHSVENIALAVEASNMQVHNSTDYSGGCINCF